MARFGCHKRHRLHAGPQGRDRLQAGACRSIVGCRRERKGGFGYMKARRNGIACMGNVQSRQLQAAAHRNSFEHMGDAEADAIESCRAPGGIKRKRAEADAIASCRARTASGVDSRAQTNGSPAAASLPAHYAHEQADEGHDASSGNLRRGAGGVSSSGATLAAGAT